ncbi:MAG: oxidoreductase [Marmoricola sp.]|nr:oxidoreductase [Marmoricola sp.]
MSTQNPEPNRTERAASVQAEAARKQRNQRVALVVGIVVVLGAIVAGGAWYTSGSGTTADTTSSGSNVALAAGDGSILVGDSTAPVKVVIYEDFLCPYCRQLEMETREFLRQNAAKGKVQVEYRPINILTQSTYSARAMNAWAAVLKNASPHAAWTLHDLLYDNQPYEASADDTTDADILALVAKAGGDNAAVEAAMKTQDAAFFKAATQVIADKGIRGTPTVFLNGTALENQSVDQIAATIEKAVAQAR